MAEIGQKGQDQGNGPLLDTRKEKPQLPKSGKTVANQSESWNSSRPQTTVNSSATYAAPEQTYFYGGYGDGSINWGENLNSVNTNNLHIMSPAVYNDNGSLLYNLAYGFDPYGQFSPIASPLSPVMIDGQLYSTHQVPVTPSYYTEPVSSTGLATPSISSSSSQEMFYGPASGYYLHYPGSNSLGFYNGYGESVSSQSTPVGILGPYEHSFAQTPYHGYGFFSNSSTTRYPQNGSYEGSRVNNHGLDKEGKHRDRDSVSLAGDRNRGPRASNPKGSSPADHTLNLSDIYNRADFVTTYEKAKFFVIKSFSEDNVHRSIKYGVWASTSNGNRKLEGKHRDRDSVSLAGDRNRGPRASNPKGSSPADHTLNLSDIYNRADFVTTYEKAKFFVIKSFSEDNVHRSIKYGVWASTSNGNRKLDAAYQEAQKDGDTSQIFLFFSVNASGQFCGVAEMIGPVDFENDADYWQQDRWSGQFRVKWHIVKDVPNSQFRHILLESNENKPVTHSRDSQEVKLEEGNAMMKIFKEHDADTSVLDDFVFYDEREKSFKERRAKEQVSLTKKSVDVALVNQLADRVADSLQLEKHKEVQ